MQIKKLSVRVFLAFMVGAVFAVFAYCSIPNIIKYQGVLSVKGQPFTGTQTMIFKITNSDGSAVYYNTGSVSVSVNNGMFTYPLQPTGINWTNSPYYLEVTINGQLLLPREEITSTAYALAAQSITNPSGAKAGYVLTSDANGNGSWQANSGANLLSSTNTWTAGNTFKNVSMSSLKMTASPTAGYVLTSTDTAGDAAWLPVSTAAVLGIVSSTNTWTAPNTWTSSSTFKNAIAVTGMVTVSSFTLASNPQNGYVLTSNAAGNATWQAVGSNLLGSTNTWTAPQAYASSVTINNVLGMEDNSIENVYTLVLSSGGVITSDSNGEIQLPSNDLDMNSNNILAPNYIEFPAVVSPAAPAAGNIRFYGSNTEGNTRPVYQGEDGIEVVIGRDELIVGQNTTGAMISQGQAVYISGANGNVPTVGLAKANSIATLPCAGIALSNVANGAFGYFKREGLITGVNTTGYNTNDTLWVSPITAGALTNVEPSYPNFAQKIGQVLVSGNNGSVFGTVAPFVGGTENGTNAQNWTAAGRVTVSSFTMATGATLGYVLTADASGNATWQLASTVTVTGLLSSTNTWTAPNAWTSSATFSNNVGVAGKLTVSSFTLTTGITSGYVLTADASGNGTWESISTASIMAMLSSTNTWTAPQAFASSTTFSDLVGISTADAYGINISSYVRFADGTVIISTSAFGNSNVSLSSTNTWTAPNTWASSGTFQNNLGVSGRVTVSSFTLTSGITSGYVLTADASGNGTWQSASTAAITSILGSTNTWIAPNTWTSSATFSNNVGISGRVTVSSFTLATAFTSGYVLTSDGSGNGTWQQASTSTVMGLLNSTNTWTAPQAFGSSVTINNVLNMIDNSIENVYTLALSSGEYITSNSNGEIQFSDNLDMNGSNILNPNYAEFPAVVSPAPPAAGNIRLYGSDVEGHTRPVYQDDDGIEVTIGRDSFLVCQNTSGSTISKGQAVYETGSNGNVPTVSLAKANSLSTLPCLGLAWADIANGAFGYILRQGLITGVNTSSFSNNQIIYVSASAAGALTNVSPAYPNLVQTVGDVLVSANNGSIMLSVASTIDGAEIGTINPSWTAAGRVTVSSFTMATGAASGYILTSDGSGNGTWQSASTAAITLLLSSANTWTAPQTWNSTGTFNNTQYFTEGINASTETVSGALNTASLNVAYKSNLTCLVTAAQGINTSTITITNGSPQTGYVLTATDTGGDAAWESVGSGTNTWTAPQAFASSTTFNGLVGISTETIAGTSAIKWLNVTSTASFANTIYASKGINTSTITITNGAVGGYVLTSLDSSGDAAWLAVSTAVITALLSSTNTWTASNTWLSTGTFNATQTFAKGINTSTITITSGAGLGYLLESDANGNATWVSSASFSNTGLLSSTNTWTAPQTWNSTGTFNNTQYFTEGINASTETVSGALNTASLNVAYKSNLTCLVTAAQGINTSTITITNGSPQTGYVLTATDTGGDAAWESVGSGTNTWTAPQAFASSTTFNGLVGISTETIAGTSAIKWLNVTSTASFANTIYASKGINTSTITITNGAVGGYVLTSLDSSGDAAWLAVSTAVITALLSSTNTWTASNTWLSTGTFNNTQTFLEGISASTIAVNYGIFTSTIEVNGTGLFDDTLTADQGINTSTLTVTGASSFEDTITELNGINTSTITITNGAVGGYVLTALDNSGDAVWMAASTASVAGLLNSTNTWTAPNTWTSSATFNNGAQIISFTTNTTSGLTAFQNGSNSQVFKIVNNGSSVLKIGLSEYGPTGPDFVTNTSGPFLFGTSSSTPQFIFCQSNVFSPASPFLSVTAWDGSGGNIRAFDIQRQYLTKETDLSVYDLGTNYYDNRINILGGSAGGTSTPDISLGIYGVAGSGAVITSSGTISFQAPLQIPSGAGSGLVLTSDVSGNATWQSVSTSAVTALLNSTNTWTGSNTWTSSATFQNQIAASSITVTNSLSLGGYLVDNNRMQIAPLGSNPSDATFDSTSVFEVDANDGVSADIAFRLSNDAALSSPAFLLGRSRGTLNVPTNVSNGDDLGYIMWYAYNGGSWNRMAWIRSRYQGDGTTNYADLSFQTANGGLPNEKMRITPDGLVGIGTTNPAGKLHVSSGTLIVDGSPSGIVNTYGIITSTIQITQSAVSGYVLTSDGSGNGTWQPITLVSTASYAINAGQLAGNTSSFYLSTGTAASQYVPYAGATGDVNLNSKNLTNLNYLQFPGIGTPSAPSTGNIKMYSTTTQGFTLPIFQDTGGIEVTLSRDQILVCQNMSGATITKGQAVYITGANGNIPTVALSKADSSTTLPCLGVAMANITNNSFGYFMKQGIITGINTSAYNINDTLYVSSATAGALTNVRPSYPYFVQKAGTVLVQGSNGSVALSVANYIGGMESGTNLTQWTAAGRVTVSSFTMATGATSGYVLTSDSSGNGTWQATSTGLLNSTNTWTAPQSYVSSTTFTGLVGMTSATMSGQLTSTVANTGTAPFVITSTAIVANLDAGYLNGLAGSSYAAYGATGTWTAPQSYASSTTFTGLVGMSSATLSGQLTSTVANTGNPPFVITSTAIVANLDAGLLNGLPGSSYVAYSATGTWTAPQAFASSTTFNGLVGISTETIAGTSTIKWLDVTSTSSFANTMYANEGINTSTISLSGQLTSTVPNTGTAPFVITSTAIVTNLDAGYLNGLAGSSYAAYSATGTWTAPQTHTSSVTITGTNSAGYSLGLSSGIIMPSGTVNAGAFIGDGTQITNVTDIGDRNYAVLAEEQASGTNGGTFTSGAWQTRNVNTVIASSGTQISLASNTITLSAGTWKIEAWAVGNRCGLHKTRFQNTTDATTAGFGEAVLSATGNFSTNVASHLVGVVTITSTKNFQLQHQCQTTRATDGFGLAAGFSQVEVYSEVIITKLAN